MPNVTKTINTDGTSSIQFSWGNFPKQETPMLIFLSNLRDMLSKPEHSLRPLLEDLTPTRIIDEHRGFFGVPLNPLTFKIKNDNAGELLFAALNKVCDLYNDPTDGYLMVYEPDQDGMAKQAQLKAIESQVYAQVLQDLNRIANPIASYFCRLQ